MPKNVIIIGAGGHAKVIADIVLDLGDNLIGFLDDDELKQDKEFYRGCKVIGKVSDYSKYMDNVFIVAVGSNYTRMKIVEKINDVVWYTAIHPNAVVSETAKIGDGTVVMAGVVINADALIGNHCIINTGATIDHDNVIDDFVHISPGVHLAGTVKIGKCSWVGIGATVVNNVSISSDTILGAGATALKNISEPGVYVGTPAIKVG